MQNGKIPDLEDAARWLGWSFWLIWVLANTVGWIVGMSLAWLLGEFITLLTQDTWMVVFWAIGGMIVGVNFGINQWFLLRPLRASSLGRRAKWWVWATILGWTVSLVLVIGLGAGARIGFPLVGLLIGAAVGIPQTLVLSPENSRRWLWALAHSAAWTIALSVVAVVDRAIGFASVGVITGAIGGAALIRIIGKEPAEE